MKAKFIGDPSHPGEQLPDIIDVFGVTFERDKFSEIPKKLEGKFEGNSHFEVQGAKKSAAPEETGESTAEFSAHVATISDRDGLEAMLKDEKRPAARGVIERRLAALPQA